MKPKMLGLADCDKHALMSDLSKSISLEWIIILLLFNIILSSGICFLIEHDAMEIIMTHIKMIFKKPLLTT